MENYWFTNCLNPQHIRNPYTKETLVVGCGKCEACQLQKSIQASLKCKLETLSNKHVRFVTLTYADEYIPKMIEYNADELPYHSDLTKENFYYFVDSQNPDEIITYASMSFIQLRKLQDKCNLGRCIPYLKKRDLQLFMKRLRKHLSKYSDEKIRYYAVGEMGPVHYRPHFHLLLWFKEDKAVNHIRKCVRAAWKYGRIDVQKPIGDASNYVAGYLNGSCHLPKLFRNGQCKPFNCHSYFLGEEFLRKEKEDVYKTPAKDFVKRCVPINGSVKEIHVWRSLTTYYFPKSYGFTTSNYASLFRTYRLFEEASSFVQKTFPGTILNPMNLTREIVRAIHMNYKNDTLLYLIKTYNYNVFSGQTNLERFTRQVYQALRLSYHFLYFVCDDLTWHESERKIYLITKFYKDLDYENLKNQYINQQKAINYGLSLDELNYFYDWIYSYDENILKLKDLKCFKQFKEKVLSAYESNAKKKKLNDLNKVLYNF